MIRPCQGFVATVYCRFVYRFAPGREIRTDSAPFRIILSESARSLSRTGFIPSDYLFLQYQQKLHRLPSTMLQGLQQVGRCCALASKTPLMRAMAMSEHLVQMPVRAISTDAEQKERRFRTPHPSTHEFAQTPWKYKGPNTEKVQIPPAAARWGNKHTQKHYTWWLWKVGPGAMHQGAQRTVRRRVFKPQVISSEEWKLFKKRPRRTDLNSAATPRVKKKVKPPSGKYLIKLLKHEEKEKIAEKWPRHVDKFKTGDKIWIYMRVGLHTEGTEIQKGTVISMRGKGGYDTHFVIINWIGRVTYEMQFPLWLPQIKKIVKKGETVNYKRRMKMWEIRKMNPSLYQVL
eukprot:g66720.t1